MNETIITLPKESSQYDSEDCDSDDLEETTNNVYKHNQISSPDHINDSLVNSNKPKLPYFESVSVVNSNDVHFGHKTIYKGPVTIKQFVYANGEVVKSERVSDSEETPIDKFDNKTPKNGIYNPSFVEHEDELSKATAANGSLPGSDNSTSFQRINKGITVFFAYLHIYFGT